ncbi:hypothetical protein [Thermosipho melanesiensis]|uniref:Uncharacterized protein n=1 Tax=Thermosipho melanesiensis TaxID=46541 RepID=A0ABN4UWT7_9BACT|nr:hypothetical protein [Thermosipho melanesiensis]APT74613.1 hypothetical protein BW47_09170 [Thermosipho melanesiensis]
MKRILILSTIILLILSMTIVALYGKGIIKYTWILKIPGRIPGGPSVPSFEVQYTRLFISFLLNIIAIIFLIALFYNNSFKITLGVFITSVILIFTSMLTYYNLFQLIALISIISLVMFLNQSKVQ